MDDTFKITIRTPEREVVSMEAESVYLTTETGDMMLLSNHIAFSGAITYSPVIIKNGTHEEEYVTYRGLVFFSNIKNEANILCQRADLKGKVDYDGLKAYLKLVDEYLAKGESLSEIHMQFLEGEKIALVQQIESKEE